MRFLIYLLVILYLLSPYDLVPDFFLGAGWIDDVVVLGVLWYYFFYRQRKTAGQRNGRGYWHGTRERASFRKEQDAGDKETKDLNPYEVLGIKETASMEEIRAAYRRLANKYHPDKVMHLGEEFRILAEKRFKEIQKAYQKLAAK